jgi:hypothetical protein
VHETVLKSGWETFLVAVPFVAILLAWLFRLDVIFATPKQAGSLRRPLSGTDEEGRIILSDPDGRPWSGAYGPK